MDGHPSRHVTREGAEARVTLGTAGHIDHGKTALIRALTGVDTDRLPEEKSRGITIDLGFARLDTPGGRIAFVDVPGHERFIRNMVAGSAGVDAALLVVAADDGVMPQTVEHLAILDLLGVRAGLVCLTKCDLADQEMLELVESDVRELIATSFLGEAPIVRTSTHAGEGIEQLRAALESLAASVAGDGDDATDAPDSLARLPIDRVFVKEGLGTIVTGTLRAGSIAPGAELEVQPPGRAARVRGVQTHGESVARARRGERVAIQLAGIHHTEVRRGHELATPGLLEPTRVLTVRLRALASAARPIRHRARIRVHLGTQEVIAGVRLLEGNDVEPGQSALAQLVCHEPVVATGRQALIARAESPMTTIGGGRVLLVSACRPRRNDEAALAALCRLESGDPRERAEGVLSHRGERGGVEMDLAREAGLDLPAARAQIAAMRRDGAALSPPGWDRVLHVEAAADLEGRALRALERLHAGPPRVSSVPRSRLAHRLGYLEPGLVAWILDRLADRGRVRLGPETVAAPALAPRLSPEQQRLREAIEEAMRDAAFKPPDASALADRLGIRERDVTEMIEMLVGEGVLTHAGSGIHVHAARAREMYQTVARAMAREGALTVARIRDLLGTSRRFAVPFCEHLDRVGVTKRRGDSRVPGPHADRHLEGESARAPGSAPRSEPTGADA